MAVHNLTQSQRAALSAIFLGRYKSGGRGEMDPVLRVPQYNCWGLCMAAGAVFGHVVPEVKSPALPTARAVNSLCERFQSAFLRLDAPRAGCLVAFRTHPRMVRAVNHFGIMLDDSRFLHIQKDTAVHVLRLEDAPYLRFFAGWYWAREGGSL